MASLTTSPEMKDGQLLVIDRVGSQDEANDEEKISCTVAASMEEDHGWL
jgi:hypothetical protein